MECLPVKTRALLPPQDDLYEVLRGTLPVLRDTDVVVVTSKVVSIHEGRCVPKAAVAKETLVAQEADILIPRSYWPRPVSIKQHAFIGAGGIDESNGDEHYVLLPSDPFASAARLHQFLKETFQVTQLGVVITDSASQPFRLGATGMAIAWWGIEPLLNHVGRADLFGREIKAERSNLVDGLAAAATVVSGEVDEAIPVVIMRGVPGLIFTDGNTEKSLFVPPEEDIFRVLYEQFLPPPRSTPDS